MYGEKGNRKFKLVLLCLCSLWINVYANILVLSLPKFGTKAQGHLCDLSPTVLENIDMSGCSQLS